MLTLDLQVPKNRASLAMATLREGSRILFSDFAAASATPSIAAKYGNLSCDARYPRGHPPFGNYGLIGHARNAAAPNSEYGSDMFLFTGGQYRPGLLAYGGEAGTDKQLRRTQGGIRLSRRMIDAMLKHLPADTLMTLTLRKMRPADKPSPLSVTEPPDIKPPNDEVSLIWRLFREFDRAPSLVKSTPSKHESRHEFRFTYSSGSGNSFSSSDEFRGQGGQYAGGGASGSWETGSANRVAAAVPVGEAAVLAVGAAIGSEAVYTTYASLSSYSFRESNENDSWSGDDSDSGSSGSSSNDNDYSCRDDRDWGGSDSEGGDGGGG
jgi:hypothetical protein